jgi:hypothetical protein
MEFDVITEKRNGDIEIGYGILRGNENIVFIKSGNGGSYEGYNGKYLRFAHYLREKYGCSVICASNPVESKNSLREDIEVICEYTAERGFSRAELRLFGNSDGCFRALDISEKIPALKVLLVNMPLMINFYKTKERLKKLSACDISFAYGENDPSQPYLPYLQNLESVHFLSLPGISHRIELNDTQKELFAKILFE